MRKVFLLVALLLVSVLMAACSDEDLVLLDALLSEEGTSSQPAPSSNNNTSKIKGETAQVKRVIDGDTIDVYIDGTEYRVRYVGANTPERDEACYQEAKDRNAQLVQGKTLTLVSDESNVDQYGRLLRYVYVGDVMVNETLVREGWAEAVEYRPDTRHTAYFRELEVAAQKANIGCHPTGIFDDGSLTR